MNHLYQRLAVRVREWRTAGYPCERFPVIGELFDYQIGANPDELRFLRRPQLRALETYWYLRLVEQTPHTLDLYQRIFPTPDTLCAALGLHHPTLHDRIAQHGTAALWQRIQHDDAFVRSFKLESLRETLLLDYPSYIFALAMGVGKTVLIGAIIAGEFALALEYPSGPFVQNALVFAPGKTIIASLRELAAIPYDQLLPPRLYKQFAAALKLTFTRDGEKDLPVLHGSHFNIVVTNTEKIRIQKEAIRKSDTGTLLRPERADAARAEVANLRLQTIASLPGLAVFSDEAHHTYGHALGRKLKRVRQTVDYLHRRSPNLIGVVNTTGTPYFGRHPLKDVVIWYGLAEGIADGILKEVAGNIHAYSFDDTSTDGFVTEVITDFFRDYAGVRLPDGAPAKLALYFPQTADLEEARPIIEMALAAVGQSPALVLRNTTDSTPQEIDAFHRLNDPASPYRVVLLVNKGTEGWNCPSLFACALARRLKTSNNFVLQAATRCLRQVPGNTVQARIYLSQENRTILERQLRETYGATIADLNQVTRRTATEARRHRADPLLPGRPQPTPIIARHDGIPAGRRPAGAAHAPTPPDDQRQAYQIGLHAGVRRYGQGRDDSGGNHDNQHAPDRDDQHLRGDRRAGGELPARPVDDLRRTPAALRRRGHAAHSRCERPGAADRGPVRNRVGASRSEPGMSIHLSV